MIMEIVVTYGDSIAIDIISESIRKTAANWGHHLDQTICDGVAKGVWRALVSAPASERRHYVDIILVGDDDHS